MAQIMMSGLAMMAVTFQAHHKEGSMFTNAVAAGTWKGHRSSQLLQLDFVPFAGKMLGHSKARPEHMSHNLNS